MKKLTFLVVSVALFSLSSFGQSTQDKKAIQGIVADESQKGLESASISLLKAKDSSVVRTIASDKSGHFQFSGVADGKYIVSATAVGHLISYSAPVEISQS